jgi:hypothetical protein
MLNNKHTIKFNGGNVNIKIPLISNDNFVGYQQEIDSLTQVTSNDLVNPELDVEVRRFRYDPLVSQANLVFFFYDNTTNTYISNLTSNDFTIDELKNNSSCVLNSFYVLDFYDTYDVNTQSKIFTTYLTKINEGYTGVYYPRYKIHETYKNQLYYWYVPQSFINSQTASTVVGYVKLSFFNGKTGNIVSFTNNDSVTTTSQKLFFKVQLNLYNKTWKFINTNFPNIYTYEIPSNAYTNKIDDSVEKIENLKQAFPTGTIFNNTTGTYE